jgi:hypothetical protein
MATTNLNNRRHHSTEIGALARPVENPFDRSAKPDHHELWEILIARDADAFAFENWTICADDFDDGRFDGISAHGSLDPASWSLQYPTVDSYRADWLRMAREFKLLPLESCGHRELLYRMQHFSKIEISNERAVVWKQFRAIEPLTDGGCYEISAQSVYRLHKCDGRWVIVGFVGYLPLEA